ncbi:Aspartokinase 3 [Cardamine amara subsp. amara]|uniref:aspartate kinase n=1 Tax=Cardamine amara subsp. amara TaxID=228776 RepID=A0ABD1AY94_CARAN
MRVFSTFEKLGISVDVVATREVSISLTLDPSKFCIRELIQQELDHVRSSFILEKGFRVLRTNGINVQMISQGASKVNISLIVNDDEAEHCVKALHSAFFETGTCEAVSKLTSGYITKPLGATWNV